MDFGNSVDGFRWPSRQHLRDELNFESRVDSSFSFTRPRGRLIPGSTACRHNAARHRSHPPPSFAPPSDPATRYRDPYLALLDLTSKDRAKFPVAFQKES